MIELFYLSVYNKFIKVYLFMLLYECNKISYNYLDVMALVTIKNRQRVRSIKKQGYLWMVSVCLFTNKIFTSKTC